MRFLDSDSYYWLQAAPMPPKKKPAPPVTAVEDDCDSEGSEECSDPEDDIADEDLLEIQADFECVRGSARDRVAPKTRYQYDMFMAIMARFFASEPELRKHASGMTCVLPLPPSAVSRYLDHVEAKRVPVQYKPGQLKPVTTGYFKAACLCIHDLYTCEQVEMDATLRLLLFSRRRAYTRKIAEMKALGTYPQPPLRCISARGYKKLCEALPKSTPAEDGGWAWHLVACIWSYVVLLWCLLARCDRVAQLRWENFSWTVDALTVFIPKSKSDQGGDRAYYKKLFTSDNPATCPVLAVAVLFFSRDSTRSEFLFPRADTRRAGLRQLSRLMNIHFKEEDWAEFGCNPLRIAWHHFKRGGMTFLSSMMEGPTHAAVKLRADQTIMDVSRYYIFQSTGQDGFIGRLLSLLPYGQPPFCQQEFILPAATLVPWPMLVPDYDTLPSAFKFEVVPKLFAAVVRHQEWLRATLHRNHPLLSSALFTVHDSLVRGAQPHVQEQKRHASECTGIPLSLQTHLLVREALAPQAASQQVAAPLPPPAWLCDAAAAKRNNLCMRTLYPLPRGYKLNKLSVVQCWRAWWTDTPHEPLPLRFLSGKLTVAAEKVRYTRYKKCMRWIQSDLPIELCEEHPEISFRRGWTSLEVYLRLHHGVNIDADAAPSSLYDAVTKLGDAFKPPQVSALHAAHRGAPRPLDEVLKEHLEVLKAAESGAPVFAARQAVLVNQFARALQRPPKRGRPPAKGVASAPAPAPEVFAASAPAPALTLLKCCCGLICGSMHALKRHHNGAGGKNPREGAAASVYIARGSTGTVTGSSVVSKFQNCKK